MVTDQSNRPISYELSVSARTIALMLRNEGCSFSEIAEAIKEQLGWAVSNVSVSRWFDTKGRIIPAKQPKAPKATRGENPLMALDRVDPATLDLPWELRQIVANELTHIKWIQAMASAYETHGKRAEFGAFAVPHIRGLATLLSAIPAHSAPAQAIADDPMREYIEGFEDDDGN